MYNRPSNNTLAQLRDELAKRPLAKYSVLGDTNAHHPAWGGIGTKIDDGAEELLEITDVYPRVDHRGRKSHMDSKRSVIG
jgi:hypothetical protein